MTDTLLSMLVLHMVAIIIAMIGIIIVAIESCVFF